MIKIIPILWICEWINGIPLNSIAKDVIMIGSVVMQGIFIKIKLGQSKSKLVTDLVDNSGPQVQGFQSLPPVDVCDVRETCWFIFSLCYFSWNIFSFSLLPGNLSGETGGRRQQPRPALPQLVLKRGLLLDGEDVTRPLIGGETITSLRARRPASKCIHLLITQTTQPAYHGLSLLLNCRSIHPFI